jgi:DNA-binding transcriptional regulator GbsR (MarR family)
MWRFMDRFVAVLVELGIPRMPARVFVALLLADGGRLTVADLTERLQVSPAAVSGAMRYLTPLGLVHRESEPGSRRDHYRVPDDVLPEMIQLRNGVMNRWVDVMREGVDLLGPDSPAGARMVDQVAYLEFMQKEIPGLLQRWLEHKTAQETRRA